MREALDSPEAPGSTETATDGVVVVDFGGQYSQLIARRIRECGVYSELIPHGSAFEKIERRQPAGVVLSGGPSSVSDVGAPELRAELLELGVPVLGICYGMQAMVRLMGGRVEVAKVGEFGRTDLKLVSRGRLMAGLDGELTCWMSHRDTVYEAPDGFTALAASPESPVAALEDTERGLYGIQFHPEVVHTPFGKEVLKNFLLDICGCSGDWTPDSIIDEQVARIEQRVGDGRVICGLSGGVDSSTAALITHRAVGDRLTCILVDHGMLRKEEAQQVISTFRDNFKIPLLHVDAGDRFLKKLEGVVDPEEKRKIIGEEFIRTFEGEASKLDGAKFLVQGTLYSDVIESGAPGTQAGKAAARIKSHHNVGGLPEQHDFELIEPLRSLFKDEVRQVAAKLGLPEGMVWRQPFPGPGLAIRIIGGDVTHERLQILQEADAILQDEIRKAGLYRELWQSFAVLPAVKSVGVQGDERSYAYPIIIRAVTSDDAMTADWARLPYELLQTVSSRLINEVPNVNRVALDISSKPPSTIEWE